MTEDVTGFEWDASTLNKTNIKFRVEESSIPQQNGSYVVTPLGAYLRLPDEMWAKPNFAHLVDWLCNEGGGFLCGDDGSRIRLCPRNREAVLAYTGFLHFSGVRWVGGSVEGE